MWCSSSPPLRVASTTKAMMPWLRSGALSETHGTRQVSRANCRGFGMIREGDLCELFWAPGLGCDLLVPAAVSAVIGDGRGEEELEAEREAARTITRTSAIHQMDLLLRKVNLPPS